MKQKLLLAFVTVMLLTSALATIAQAQTGTEDIYDSIPNPLPPNLASIGFQARSTDEFGDHIRFDGTNRMLTSVTVAMSTWALQSTYPSMTDPNGWQHPITLNLYEVDTTGTTPAVGQLITTTTQTFQIPWRPEADTTCSTSTAWRASNGTCYNGLAFTIEFDVNVTVPDEVIFGIAYNTQTHGANPINVAGPYNSLNVAVSDVSPSVGVDVDSGLFQDSSHGGFYDDGGAGGTDTFRYDPDWSPYTPAVRFTVSYELPTSGEMLDDLQTSTAELVENRNAERALLASLNRAERYMEIRPEFARLALLQYILQVRLYDAFGLIDGDAADQLVYQAQDLMASLSQ